MTYCWALSLLVLLLTTCAPAQPPSPEPAAQTAAQGSTAPALAPAGSAPSAASPVRSLSPDLERLWQRRIRTRLEREQWKTTQRYDAAYLYMVPLHAAFERGYEPGQREFAAHVARFLQYRDSVHLKPDAQISWLQYFYFLSRFTVVAASHDRADLIPPELPAALRGWIGQLWLEGPAWQWYRKPFPGGVRERVEWKLSRARGVKGKSFEHAILDQELLLFAIAADLRRYGRTFGSPLANDSVLQEIGRYALRVYADRVAWNADSGWTFQPGIWRDHPDHLYECRQEKRAGLEPCPAIMGAEDASHSHRVPLLLRSLAEAEPAGSEGRAYYEHLLWGLERQFFSRVAVPPSAEFAGWRMRNYMDGQNGMYRWEYASLGPNQGYGPYELSGVLLHGWWAFLPGERASGLFVSLAAQFPLREDQIAVYGGPVHRKPGSPGILGDGTAELLCRLAAERPRSVTGGQ